MKQSIFKEVEKPDGSKIRVYDWARTLSYQVGKQAEIVIVCGGKGIGKTFGLRQLCLDEAIRKSLNFVDISRTKAERDDIENGYFDKLQNDGFFKNYVFKIEKHVGFYALKPADEEEKPDWVQCCYFVALSAFQIEKRRTFANVKRFIFDEFIIDTNDRHHRYLHNEFFILANILDTITREQPSDESKYKLYLLGNAVDLMNPYFRNLGINKVPKFGYQFFNDKTVLLHYVEPWDAEERKAKTLVGRMLSGTEEAKRIFDNEFEAGNTSDIKAKTSNAQFAYALVFDKQKFAVWIDYKNAYFYINEKIPGGAKNVYALTKKDGSLDHKLVNRNYDLIQMLLSVFYSGGVRYSSPALKQAFFEVLSFLGVR